tara:strand:- start:1934 stop:2107 length:174 start_codon:yes stop_codon:yes gene_type:complete
MHKVNKLRQRRKERGLPKSEQSYRMGKKNFAVEEKTEKPKTKTKKKKTKNKKTKGEE